MPAAVKKSDPEILIKKPVTDGLEKVQQVFQAGQQICEKPFSHKRPICDRCAEQVGQTGDPGLIVLNIPADLLTLSEKGESRNTCSTAGALYEHDLFINASLAYTGVEILKRCSARVCCLTDGVFLNLAEFRSQALKVA